MIVSMLAFLFTTSAFAQTTIIRIEGYEFQPSLITITVGQVVTWINVDPYNQYRIDSADGSVTSNVLTLGTTYQQLFYKAGVYPFFCANFPYMTGVVIVKELNTYINDRVQDGIHSYMKAHPLPNPFKQLKQHYSLINF